MEFDMIMFSSMFLLLMFSVWFNYRLGFANGMEQAHLYGVYETVKFLMESHSLSGTDVDTGEPATVEEITRQIAIQLHIRRDVAE